VIKLISICYYISDYGYGHASRSIAIIRRILNSSNFNKIKIYVKTYYPFNFVKHSLFHKDVKVYKSKNDIGIIFKKNNIMVDKDKTKNILDRWLASWDTYIKNEKKIL